MLDRCCSADGEAKPVPARLPGRAARCARPARGAAAGAAGADRAVPGCRARSRASPGMAARRAHPDRGCLARDRWRPLSDQAGRRRRGRRSGPISSATATTRSRAVLKYALRGRGLAGDAVRVLRQRPLDGALPAGPGRALALHDRGLDRPLRELARRSGQEAARPARTSRSNSSRASGSSRRRSSTPTAADAARLRAIAEEFGSGRYGAAGRADAVRRNCAG